MSIFYIKQIKIELKNGVFEIDLAKRYNITQTIISSIKMKKHGSNKGETKNG